MDFVDVLFACSAHTVYFTVRLWGVELASLLAISWAAAASGGPGQDSASPQTAFPSVTEAAVGLWGVGGCGGESPRFFHQTAAHTRKLPLSKCVCVCVFVFFVLCEP